MIHRKKSREIRSRSDCLASKTLDDGIDMAGFKAWNYTMGHYHTSNHPGSLRLTAGSFHSTPKDFCVSRGFFFDASKQVQSDHRFTVGFSLLSSEKPRINLLKTLCRLTSRESLQRRLKFARLPYGGKDTPDPSLSSLSQPDFKAGFCVFCF